MGHFMVTLLDKDNMIHNTFGTQEAMARLRLMEEYKNHSEAELFAAAVEDVTSDVTGEMEFLADED